MKKLILLFTTILILCSSLAFATYVEVTPGNFKSGYFNFDPDSDGVYETLPSYVGVYDGWWGANAGVFQIDFYQSQGGPYQASTYGFCVELEVTAGSGTIVTTDNLSTIDNGDQVAWLLDTYWAQADNDNKKAALQFAVWDTLYGSTTTGFDRFDNFYALGNDTTSTGNNAEIESEYTKYTTNVGTYTGNEFSILRIRDMQGEDMQDLIIKNPVPEPSTMLLFGLGLLGLGAIGRRKA